jgi:serine phosphatase RsbU (regulator of sigma subunit)
VQPARRPATRLALAVACAAAGLVATLVLDSLADTGTYAPPLAAVAVCIAVARVWPAALTAALCAAVLLPVALSGSSADLGRWVTFVVSAGAVLAFGAVLERRTDVVSRRLAGAERRFRAAEEASPEPFLLLEPIRDERGAVADFRVAYANRAALALARRARERVVGARLLAALPPDKAWLFEACVGVLQSCQPFVTEIDHAGVQLGGRYAITAVPVGDAVAATIRDVTARHRAAERDRLLAAVAAATDAAPGLRPRVEAIAALLADGPADVARVDLVTPEGGLALGAVAAVDPAAADVLRAVPAARLGSPLALAVHAGTPRLVTEITDEVLRAAGVDGEQEAALRRLAARSAVLLPLLARGRPLGVALLLRGPDRRPFDEADLDALVLLSGRAALALDNARLYEQQRAIALTLQESLLPKELPPPGRIEFAARYRAAGEGLEVGGDFYDVVANDGHLLAVVGDVCGKGPAAAAVTSLVRHTVRLTAPVAAPAAALARVNQAVRGEQRPGLFCTAAAASLLELPDGRVAVRTARAGHPPPLVVRSNGAVEALESEGMLLGWVEDIELAEATTTLGPGDALVLYTDGVVEARDGRELYGEQRLRALLSELGGAQADDLAEAVAAAAVTHAHDRPRDDLAVLVAVVQGPTASAQRATSLEGSAFPT